MRVIFPVAFGLAVPLDRPAFFAWLAVGILYVVHHTTLSSAVRRDRAEQRVMHVTSMTVDGVQLSSDDADKIREIVEGARVRGSQTVQ